MAAMTMDQREPEVAKFIDTYKYDQEMSSRRNKFGGGTSLPLNSDGYEDKQRALRDERHRDWMVQQEKPSEPVYYRVGTPEQGFPGLGSYSKQRQENNVARQKEYNALLRKQRQMEQQKMEERHRSPPRPAQPQGPQMDYNLASEQARAEERRSYQNHMGKYQYAANAAPKPTFDYEENKKILNEERKREYNQLMEKKAQEERYVQMHGRPVTPPGGLNIGAYDRQMKETAEEKKRQYKEMLDQQHNEQQKLRALDRVADVSPKYVSYRENERPLVGSPRDVNYYMQEKLEKDKFRRDLRRSPQRDNSPPSKYYNSEQNSHKTDDPNLKAYIEVEREKALSKKKYAEELLQQQKEHMYLRARQEPEMAVIDRNALSQHPTNKPPPGPGYNRPRDEPMRQNPSYWNEGRKARGPRSFDSDVSRRSSGIPGEYKNDTKSHPARDRYNHQPYPDNGYSKPEINGISERRSPVGSPPRSPLKSPLKSPQRLPPMSPLKSPPKSPAKRYNTDRRRDSDARQALEGTPLAFKTDSRRVFERPQHGQPPYPGHSQYMPDREKLNPETVERPPPPRSPYKPSDPEWLKPSEEDRPVEGTPLTEQQQRRRNEERHQQQISKPAEVVKNQYYSSDDYEKFQKEIQRKQSEEYRDFLAKQYQPTNAAQGLPIGQYRYEPKRLAMEKERNKEYNELLKQKSNNNTPRSIDGPQGLSIDVTFERRKKAFLEQQRNKEYNDFLKKQKVKNPERRHEFVDTASGPFGGLFQGLGEHGNRSEMLNKERQREYNEHNAGKEKVSGRPNWARETLPNDTDRGRGSPMKTQPPPDQYEQMLDEKRREEASRRRYDDPEYRGRLVDSRERERDGGQRFSNY